MNVTETQAGAGFLPLMRRYVIDYTNRHDPSVTEQLMEPDYELRMGEHHVQGRDGAYARATAKQMQQFPGLALTVHEIATSGDRLVMRFSEHGASSRHEGRECAWGGIGLYAWNGSRLMRNFVEQDYFSRRRQLAGAPGPVESPAIAPWDTMTAAADANAEAVVRAWLDGGRLACTDGVLLDDQWYMGAAEPLIEQARIEIDDLFSCGSTIAFHIAQHGGLIPCEGLEGAPGTPSFLHMSGIVHVVGGRVASGTVIRNRLDLARRLMPG